MLVHEPTDAHVACTALGATIPDTAHAVSVSLPSWAANVGYEEGKDWVVKKMRSGYPRFFIHPTIQALADAIVQKFSRPGQIAILFPSAATAQQGLDFIRRAQAPSSQADNPSSPNRPGRPFSILNFVLRSPDNVLAIPESLRGRVLLSAVVVPEDFFGLGKQFWQHTGEGISSRRADYLQRAFSGGSLVLHEGEASPRGGRGAVGLKGPKRYQKDSVLKAIPTQSESDGTYDSSNYPQFVEERFGRNLDASLEHQAKLAIRKRIATSTAERATKSGKVPHTTLKEDDVYLYPCGMSAIFNSHRILMQVRGQKRSIMFGFPYIDTLKILQKFGPGALFYGHASPADLDDLEARCLQGEEFLALYCEFPGNPLLKTPDLRRIRALADRFGFAVVVDETIGNFLNTHLLPAVDILVSSLTKVFSGDSNVMGGSLTLNPNQRYYQALKQALKADYQDNYWPEDAIFMERNSRDFLSRNCRINNNAELLCQMLQKSSLVKQVYYPSLSPTKAAYDAFRTQEGGYGGLFSVTFHDIADAHVFFDTLETEKGPSLGTNFTLSSPFVILAHYNELDWAAEFGAEPDLVRVSVGLEDTDKLLNVFQRALEVTAAQKEG